MMENNKIKEYGKINGDRKKKINGVGEEKTCAHAVIVANDSGNCPQTDTTNLITY